MKPCIHCDTLWNETAFRDSGNVCPDCIRKRAREWFQSQSEPMRQIRIERNNRRYHAMSTSALANAPYRRPCAKCGIVKGKQSFNAESAICRRCSHA